MFSVLTKEELLGVVESEEKNFQAWQSTKKLMSQPDGITFNGAFLFNKRTGATFAVFHNGLRWCIVLEMGCIGEVYGESPLTLLTTDGFHYRGYRGYMPDLSCIRMCIDKDTTIEVESDTEICIADLDRVADICELASAGKRKLTKDATVKESDTEIAVDVDGELLVVQKHEIQAVSIAMLFEYRASRM